MAKIQCSRCDRRYSSLRLKCPYCGAHRSKKTIRREQNDVSGAKFIIGGIVLLLLIIAVVAVVVISLRSGGEEVQPENTAEQTQYVQDEGVNSVTSEENDTQEQAEPQAPAVTVTSVSIVQEGVVVEDTTMQAGTTEEFTYETNPTGVDEIAIWTSEDETVAVVLQNGTVTAVGEGTTNITVKVGGQTGTMIVRVTD